MNYIRTLMIDLSIAAAPNDTLVTAKTVAIGDALNALMAAESGATQAAKAALVDALIAARADVTVSTVANRHIPGATRFR